MIEDDTIGTTELDGQRLFVWHGHGVASLEEADAYRDKRIGARGETARLEALLVESGYVDDDE